jgi:hypothetical protein
MAGFDVASTHTHERDVPTLRRRHERKGITVIQLDQLPIDRDPRHHFDGPRAITDEGLHARWRRLVGPAVRIASDAGDREGDREQLYLVARKPETGASGGLTRASPMYESVSMTARSTPRAVDNRETHFARSGGSASEGILENA